MTKRKGSKKENVEVRDRVSDPNPDPVTLGPDQVFNFFWIRFQLPDPGAKNSAEKANNFLLKSS